MIRHISYLGVYLLVLTLFGCTTRTAWPNAMRTTVPVLPSYPNIVQDSGHMEQSKDQWPTFQVAFQTTDSPRSVLTFYKNQLSQAGWQPSAPEDPEVLFMANKEACPIYDFFVRATSTNTKVTDVQVIMSPSPCADR